MRFRPDYRPAMPFREPLPPRLCQNCHGAGELCPVCDTDWTGCECAYAEMIPCPDCHPDEEK